MRQGSPLGSGAKSRDQLLRHDRNAGKDLRIELRSPLQKQCQPKVVCVRHSLPFALRLTLASVLLIALTTPLQSAPAPAPAPRLMFISFAANLPPPVDRLEIRQAVAYAIDRQALAAFVPGAVPAVGINHPKLPGANPHVKSYGYDPAQAKALVARVGWDPQSLLRIYLATSYRGAIWDPVREKVLESLTAVGLKAEFVPMAFAALLKLISTGGGAAYAITWESDKSDFGYPYFSVGLAWDWKFKDDADKLTHRFEQTADPAMKLQIAQDLEQLLLDQAMIVPLLFRN